MRLSTAFSAHCSDEMPHVRLGAFVHSAGTARILQGEIGDFFKGQLAILLTIQTILHPLKPMFHSSPTP